VIVRISRCSETDANHNYDIVGYSSEEKSACDTGVPATASKLDNQKNVLHAIHDLAPNSLTAGMSGVAFAIRSCRLSATDRTSVPVVSGVRSIASEVETRRLTN
jgi:hypothetical protein